MHPRMPAHAHAHTYTGTSAYSGGVAHIYTILPLFPTAKSRGPLSAHVDVRSTHQVDGPERRCGTKVSINCYSEASSPD